MISSHTVRPMPRDPKAGSATRGFDNVAFPKLIRQLQHATLEVRFKALQVAEELLAQPKSLVQCVQAGICPVLAKLLQEEDDKCRALTADRLRFVMRTPSSAASAAAAGILPVLLHGIMDRNALVRTSCYKTLLESVQHEQQRQEIVDVSMTSSTPAVQQLLLRTYPGRRVEIDGGGHFPAVAYILACAVSETETFRKNSPSLQEPSCCLALPLQLLEKLAQKRWNQVVLETIMESADAVPYLASLLVAPFPREVQLATVKLLTTLCSTDNGKAAADYGGCVDLPIIGPVAMAQDLVARQRLSSDGSQPVQVEAGCVVKLIGLTTTGHMELTIAATGALAMITTSAAGKEALLQTGEVLLFLELLDWSNLSLERNVLSIVANAAGNPQMRVVLQDYGVMEYLTSTQFSCSSTIQKARELAVQQVAFNHRPFSNLPKT